jgi:AraC-like DNA-binding protein
MAGSFSLEIEPYEESMSDVFWRAWAGQRRERHLAGSRYWWDNRERIADGTWIVQWTLRGSICFRDMRQIRDVVADDVLVFRHGESSQYGQREPLAAAYECTWVAIRGAGLDEHLRLLRHRHGGVVAGGSDPAFRDAIRTVVETLAPRRKTSRSQDASATHTLVQRLWELAENHAAAELTTAERLADRLAADPLKPWSLKRVAATQGVSREHLCRVFRERHGEPPHAFFTRHRRRRAGWLLRHTDLPLKRVASLSGFSTVHTLGRHLRESTKLSPAAYRDRYQRTTSPTSESSSTAST